MSATDDIAHCIDIANIAEAENYPDQADIELWLTSVLNTQQQSASEISVAIVGKQQMQQLNRDFRGKDKPTNVLSFPAELPENLPSQLLGDIVICAEIVTEEATLQNKELTAHWAHMLIHGCLHLLGYDHIEEQQAVTMETLEIALLKQLGFANPYLPEDRNKQK